MASSNFDFPDNSPLVDDNKMVTQGWLQAMSRWQNAIQTIYMSGTTADRPTKLLWIGRYYYDRTLGKPVWVDSVRPTVWHDASGAVA